MLFEAFERTTMSVLFVCPKPCLELECYIAEFQHPNCIPQALKAKCRELSRSVTGLLVAPATQSLLPGTRNFSNKACLWIVAKVDFMSSKELKAKLSSLDIVLREKVEVSGKILEVCYRFSAMARLAPKWNAIGSWLVQGLQFLTASKASAVDVAVSFSSSDVALSLNTHKICFQGLRPDDLGVTPGVMKRFRNEASSVINELEITANQCLVLPNLTKAFIYSVSHRLPVSPEFPTYDKLRLHWKKQHGMILPDSQSTFYQVYFSVNSKKFFSYPGCCVLKSFPIVYPERCVREVAESFLADLKARLPSLCGYALEFQAAPLEPPRQLQTASGPLKPPLQAMGTKVDYHEKHYIPKANQENEKPHESEDPVKKSCLIDESPRPSYGGLRNSANQNASNVLPDEASTGKGAITSESSGKTQCQPPSKAPKLVASSKTTHKLSLKKRPSSQTSSQLLPPVKKPCAHLEEFFPTLGMPSREEKKRPEGSSQSPGGFTLPQPLLVGTPTPTAALPSMAAHNSSSQSELKKKVEKAKIPELKKWLSAHDVKFRSKDKKPDLVMVVMNHITRTSLSFP